MNWDIKLTQEYKEYTMITSPTTYASFPFNIKYNFILTDIY